jgi:hypothetical protein
MLRVIGEPGFEKISAGLPRWCVHFSARVQRLLT